MDMIVNKVAESGIVTLDPAQFVPKEGLAGFDIKPFLFREMILKEKDYRAALQGVDWQQYAGMQVAIHCSADAIVPVWAYMLAAVYLTPVAASVYYGTPDELVKKIVLDRIAAIDVAEYVDKRVVIKGCGETPVPEAAYTALTALLQPKVKSIMYGEPCSTVPLYKAPKQ
jgi:Protein of unknown function (DUF2480)